MCGICGFTTKKLNMNQSHKIIQSMTNKLEHRGPDDKGHDILEYTDTLVGLGHTRLSIIDLTKAGHQPMFDKSRNLAISFNGEIYNYKEIKKILVNQGYSFDTETDTEVILYSYQEWGENFVDKLNGIFSLALMDVKNGKLFLYRDPLGVKPLYYFYDKNIGLIFSSEIKSILLHPNIETKVNKNKLAEYLINSWVMEPDTLFKNIYKLSSGHYLKYDLKDQNINIKEYWNITNINNKLISSNDIRDTIKSVIKQEMVSDVPIGLYLSGGIDSSLIAKIVDNNTQSEIYALTAHFSDESEYEGFSDDLYYTNLITDRLNIDLDKVKLDVDNVELYKKLIWYMDEPISNPSIVPTYLLAKIAKSRGKKVMFSGLGADEIFGGYIRYKAFKYLKHLSKTPAFTKKIPEQILKYIQTLLNLSGEKRKLIRDLRRFLNSGSSEFPLNFMLLNSYFSLDEVFRLTGNNNGIVQFKDKLNNKQKIFKDKNLTDLQKAMYFDMKGFLSSNNLISTDKASMAASVEVRVPLINKDIVEDVYGMSDDFKVGKSLKVGLKSIASDYIPTEIIKRSKSGFTMPVKKWIMYDLKDTIIDMRNNGKVNNYLNQKEIQKIIDNHYSKKEDNAMKIWDIYTLNLWLNTFDL